LAQLIIAYTQFDPEKAQMYSKQLPPLDLQDTDIDLLENTNWMMGSKLIKKSTLKPDTTGSKAEVEKKRKKKRKIILPKNFNPEVLPNPERWLPRHERTGYRKKKDRRYNKETGIGKGTQGSSNVSSEQFNIKHIAAQPKPQTAQVPSENAPRLQHRKGGQYKKKKKGK